MGPFGKIVTSLVDDIIMPCHKAALRERSPEVYKPLYISLDGNKYRTLAEAAENGAATLNYGLFISALIDFFIIAFSMLYSHPSG